MGIVLKNEVLVSVNHREDRNESINYLNRLKLVIPTQGSFTGNPQTLSTL